MKTHRIAGGAGVQLHVVETGNPQGRPIVFIHGALLSCGVSRKRERERLMCSVGGTVDATFRLRATAAFALSSDQSARRHNT